VDEGRFMLERAYPRWLVWQADSGLWWASARANLTAAQRQAGCREHLTADAPEELRDLIRDQDARVGITYVPMRLVVWGLTETEVDRAVSRAGWGESREAWEFVEVCELRGPCRPEGLNPEDRSSVTGEDEKTWAYVVYRAA